MGYGLRAQVAQLCNCINYIYNKLKEKNKWLIFHQHQTLGHAVELTELPDAAGKDSDESGKTE